jgi:hypothetical protein
MTDDDDRDDPGPHTHVYVLDDRGEVCAVCGEPGTDAPIGLEMPEYDFEGGGAGG